MVNYEGAKVTDILETTTSPAKYFLIIDRHKDAVYD
jgi:hypothetical protein